MLNIEKYVNNLKRQEPFLWINPEKGIFNDAKNNFPQYGMDNILEASKRLDRFAPLLAMLFPELDPSGGIIESDLLLTEKFKYVLSEKYTNSIKGALYIKADHALPVAGSVKARGGIYAVLHFAESVAIENDLLKKTDDYRVLAEDNAKHLFGKYELAVASTGNLGLSIGIMASALGFKVSVHMSSDAKEWKKERLRNRGVTVVEHKDDYTAACKAARDFAESDPYIFFIDDENSEELFFGYSVAALRLEKQLKQEGIVVDKEHPLFVYIPCGVGGAPGGVTFGLKHIYGDNVHCFFVEPVGAPCMVYGMLTGRHAESSITELGFGVTTDADGLAVGSPSHLVGKLMEKLLSGCATETDKNMYLNLKALYEAEGVELEPSAAAGYGGLRLLLDSEEGQEYINKNISGCAMDNATHIIWTTGGSFVPEEMHKAFRDYAASL